MQTKEFNEVKKQFKITNCNISRLRGCYVNDKKEKVSYINHTFLNLPEEEQHKYLEILKKTLTGKIGKNLLDMKFRDSSRQKSLIALRDSGLKDDKIIDSFYDSVIESVNYVGNYLILVIDQMYDIPCKAEDNTKIGESDDVYHYVLCSICPTDLSKAGISYFESNNEFHNAERSFMVKPPIMGFLYPAFNERMEDRESIAFYSKDTKKFDDAFVNTCLGCYLPTSANTQQTIFSESLSETYDDKCSFDLVENITEKVKELSESNAKESLTENGIGHMLESSGMEKEKVETFKSIMKSKMEENEMQDKEINVNNILPDKKNVYEINGLKIKADEQQSKYMEVKKIDGKLCLVIETSEEFKMNGIPITE